MLVSYTVHLAGGQLTGTITPQINKSIGITYRRDSPRGPLEGSTCKGFSRERERERERETSYRREASHFHKMNNL